MATDLSLKEDLSTLTDRIVSSYEEVGDINHLDHCPLPSPTAVVQMIDDLFEVLYPGYRRRQNLHMGNVMYYVGDLIDKLHDDLTEQIARAIRHEATREALAAGEDHPCDSRDFEAEGQLKAIEFLNDIPTLRSVLATDVQAAYDGDPAAASLDEIIFCYPGLEAITVYRLANKLHRLGVPLLPRIMTEWVHDRTGIDIHPAATIGPSFFIDHGTGVVIGGTCEISDHVKIYQGVTLGALSFKKDENGDLVRGQKRHPTIESNVVIYANATILGGKTVVGHGSIVGASVTLMQSVEPNTMVRNVTPEPEFITRRVGAA